MAALPESLMPHVASATCLNEDSRDNLAGVLRAGSTPGQRALLKSDCDEQLLMHFEFKPNEAANVRAVKLVAPKEGFAIPRTLHAYANVRNLTFASVEGVKPHETVTLKWQPVASDPSIVVAVADLRAVANVNAFQLTLFFPDNSTDGEDDVTVLAGISLHGGMAKGLGTTALPQKG